VVHTLNASDHKPYIHIYILIHIYIYIMDRLVKKIKEQFSHEAIIEIYVLDETGRPMELYSGLPSGLTPSYLHEVLKDPSTFYVFSVVGIDENFADLIDIHRDKMSRKEFCWLTDPSPPQAVDRTSTTISLKWDPVNFCGVDVSVVADSITYTLEACEGQEWRGGLASKFVTDLSADDYRVMCKGSQVVSVTVEDLKPAQWYHFRVSVQYAGTVVTSSSRAVSTLTSPPSKPSQPNIYLIMNENDMFVNRDRWEPQVRLTWGPPPCNGSQIRKYHIQLKEYYSCASDMVWSRGSPSRESDDEDDGHHTSRNTVTNIAGENLVSDKWRTVYCNLVRSHLLDPPRFKCKAWGIRLRAMNASGWSPYCDVMILDHRSHPKLFTTRKPTTASKLPPLQKSPSRWSPKNSTPSNSQMLTRKSYGDVPTKNSFFSNQEGIETHTDNVDVWTAPDESDKQDSQEELQKTFSSAIKNLQEESKEDTTSSRAQSAPNVRFESSRCKTPNFLLPANHKDRERVGKVLAVDVSLSPRRSIAGKKSVNSTHGSTTSWASEVQEDYDHSIEREIDRIWERTCFNREFIREVIQNISADA